MRRVLGLLVGLIALLLVAASGYWYWAELRLASGLRQWEAAQRASGWTVSNTRETRGGWPLVASLDIGTLSLALPAGPAWRSDATTLELPLLQPRAVTVRLRGAQHIVLPGLSPLEVHGSDLQATLPLRQKAGRSSIGFAGTRLIVSADGQQAQVGSADLDLTTRDGVGRDGAAVSFRLDATAIDLPGDFAWPLGPLVKRVGLQGALSGPLAPSASPVQAARVWQAGGGSLLLQQVDGIWGPLAWSASARVSLDSALQPVASVSARMTGQDAALQKMAASGLIGPGTETAARAVLGLMAERNDGGAPRIDLPMTLSGGLLYVGGIPLLRVPPIAWPQG